MPPGIDLWYVNMSTLIPAAQSLIAGQPAQGSNDPLYDAFKADYLVQDETITTDGLVGLYDHKQFDLGGMDYEQVAFVGTVVPVGWDGINPGTYSYLSPVDHLSATSNYRRNVAIDALTLRVAYEYRKAFGGSGSSIEHKTTLFYRSFDAVFDLVVEVDYDGNGYYSSQQLNMNPA